MDLSCDERPSDSLYVERIWYSRSERASSFVSIANTHWEMVVSRQEGRTIMTVRGPETRATPAYCPPDAEFFGITFRPGAVMPMLPAKRLMDRSDVNLPEAGGKSFWLNGRAWDFPDVENADTFVDWLVRDGLLVYDPIVGAVLQGKTVEMSLRTVQRRMLEATGLTHNTFYQIERVRLATALLKQGVSILDTVERAGYADQPHMTRAMKQFVGHTPTQIISESRRNPLSLLFKTIPF